MLIDWCGTLNSLPSIGGSMSKIVTDFKVLTLELQLQAYPQITAAFNAAKDARRPQLEAEIRTLGFARARGKEGAYSRREVTGARKTPLRLGAAEGQWSLW
jgi:hypothetical protein